MKYLSQEILETVKDKLTLLKLQRDEIIRRAGKGNTLKEKTYLAILADREEQIRNYQQN